MTGQDRSKDGEVYLLKLLIFTNIECNLIKNIMSQKTENKENSNQREAVTKGSTISKKTGTGRTAVTKGSTISKKTGA